MFSTESAQNHDQKLNGEKLAWSTQDAPNHAFVLLETRKFGFEERPMPTLQSLRDVLIRVIATGLCGSDIHYWHHGRIGKYVVENPIILGHESAGVVEACGPDVKSLAVGDRVALEPGVGCNTCEACRSGRYNLCGSMRFAATPPYDGTLATYYVLPEECCFVLPPHISFQEGTLVEPLAVAVHCCRLAGDMQGKSVIVFGAGPIGLLGCAVARASGAANVVVVDIVQSRLDFATRFGATATYLMSSQLPEVNADILLAQTGLSEGADVIIEATGAEPCINCGIHALKRGGTFVQAGLGTPIVSFPVAQICDKEATFKGSFRYGPGDYKFAVELLRSGRISVKELVTHEFSFAEAEQAFINVLERRGIKSIIYGPSVDQKLVNETAML